MELEEETRSRLRSNQEQGAGHLDKGKVDAGLAERVREVSPAFIAPLPICTAYGPDGYPSTIFHLMASGNYFDGNMLPPAGVGTGLVG